MIFKNIKEADEYNKTCNSGCSGGGSGGTTIIISNNNLSSNNIFIHGGQGGQEGGWCTGNGGSLGGGDGGEGRLHLSTLGCADEFACNYNINATDDNASCLYDYCLETCHGEESVPDKVIFINKSGNNQSWIELKVEQ